MAVFEEPNVYFYYIKCYMDELHQFISDEFLQNIYLDYFLEEKDMATIPLSSNIKAE